MAIDNTSSAYEEVPAANCTYPYDERGGIGPRPGITGANCDAGAFEFRDTPSPTTPIPAAAVQRIPITTGPVKTVEVMFSSPPTLSGYGFGGWCTVQSLLTPLVLARCFPTRYSQYPSSRWVLPTSRSTLSGTRQRRSTSMRSETGSTCADATTNACPTIQDAITKAESLHNSAVTIEVAAGTYNEGDVIHTSFQQRHD